MEQPVARILVIDDEVAVRFTLDLLLRRQGYDVTTVATGAEALALLEQCSYDMLLIDLRLPDVSGIEIARHTRCLQPAPAVIILTGSTELVEDAWGQPRTMSFECMLKTVSPQDVLVRIARIIAQQRSHGQSLYEESRPPPSTRELGGPQIYASNAPPQ